MFRTNYFMHVDHFIRTWPGVPDFSGELWSLQVYDGIRLYLSAQCHIWYLFYSGDKGKIV